ncbi:MAG: enoyl-ACP reductase [Acidobacteriota bacterium]|nr:enoyl-ACP reductase [Acidobacteriota bacterium]
MSTDGRMQGKVGLIVGVANHRSLAWAIAQAVAADGARVVLTYQSRFEDHVKKLAAALSPTAVVLPCDVQVDSEIEAVCAHIGDSFGGLDFLVHGVAFAQRDDLTRSFVETSRDGFRVALDVSAYSLIALARGAQPLMQARGGGSILTLSFLGSDRVFPNYNVMGVAKAALESSVRYLASDLGPQNIRVNAVSAGPVKTLAAAGIGGFSSILNVVREKAPLRRAVETSEIGDAAAFLLSDAARGITGEVLMVDAGYHVLGL